MAQIDFSNYETATPPPPKTADGKVDFSAYEEAPKSAIPPVSLPKSPIDKLSDWLKQKRDEAEQRRLSAAARGETQTVKPQSLSPAIRREQEKAAAAGEPGIPADTALYGMGADTATMAKQLFTPKSLGTAAAAIAAPELTFPYLTYTGAKQALTPKQEGETQPEAVQRRLLGASQAVGGAAGIEAVRTGAVPTLTSRASGATAAVKGSMATSRVAAASKAAEAADADLLKALGPTKSNPITDTDIKAARPFIEEQHAADPITKETAVTQFRDHADAGIKRIEDHIDQLVSQNPTDTIAGHAKPIDYVKAALSGNVKKSFVTDGLKAIDEYGVSDDMTVQQAEKVRKQLNADNQSAMKAKNNYDLANMRTTDPAFAAREALAKSLRDGIYGKLEQRGAPGIAELRQTEGSLIKVRNAAQSRSLQGESRVAGTESGGAVRRMLGRVAKLSGTSAGASAAGPAGAIIGSEIGEGAQKFIAPGKLTRNELIARSFEKPQTTGPQLPQIAARPAIAGQLGQGAVVTPQPGASIQTPGEVQTQTVQAAMNSKPNFRIIREQNGRFTKQYLTSSGGKVIREVPASPAEIQQATGTAAPTAATEIGNAKSVAEFIKNKPTATNASGESSASQEAINRTASEKAGNIKRFRIDTRSGNEIPLIGVDAVDAQAGPYDVIVKRGPKGEEILDTGAKARPYKPKGARK